MACSPLGRVYCVTACVVYGRFDSKIRFENESDGRFHSRFDSIGKNDSQVPTQHVPLVKLLYYITYVTVSTYKLQQHDELNHMSHTPCLRGPCTDGERPLASEQHSSLGRLLASVCELTQTRTVVKHTMTTLSHHWHKRGLSSSKRWQHSAIIDTNEDCRQAKDDNTQPSLTQTRTVVKHTMTTLSYHWHKLHLHSQAANLRLWHLMNSLTHEICPMTLILAVSRSLWS